MIYDLLIEYYIEGLKILKNDRFAKDQSFAAALFESYLSWACYVNGALEILTIRKERKDRCIVSHAERSRYSQMSGAKLKHSAKER